MDLDNLVSDIKRDWEVERYPEDWSFIIKDDKELEKHATPEFLKENRGLIFKNSKKVNKIYLTCFPSTYVLKEIAKRNIKDVLLVSHHPFDWDGTGMGFKTYSKEDYELMKKYGISVLFMHVPWDAVRNEEKRVSTAYGTANVLGMKVKGEFEEYFGAIVSLYGDMPGKNFDELAKRYVAEKLGNNHLNLFKFGPNKIGLVAIVPGGGNSAEWLDDAYKLGVRTYLTGCTDRCKHPYQQAKTKEFLAKAKELKLNIIGASHYLTEKWAMEQSKLYFGKFGLPVEFIEDLAQMKVLD